MEIKNLLKKVYKVALYLYWPVLLVGASLMMTLLWGFAVLCAGGYDYGDHPTTWNHTMLVLIWLGIWLLGLLALLPVFGVAAIFGWAKKGATAKGAILSVYKWIVQIVCWASVLGLVYYALTH